MSTPDEHPRERPPRSFTVHPVSALDGVLLHVIADGETVGWYFGPTEEAATAEFAEDLKQAASISDKGESL